MIYKYIFSILLKIMSSFTYINSAGMLSFYPLIKTEHVEVTYVRITNLEHSISDSELKRFLGSDVKSLEIKNNEALVMFRTRESAIETIRNYDGLSIAGCRIGISLDLSHTF